MYMSIKNKWGFWLRPRIAITRHVAQANPVIKSIHFPLIISLSKVEYGLTSIQYVDDPKNPTANVVVILSAETKVLYVVGVPP